ncbi:SRR1-like protein isoform X2 [Amphiura filiformis]|uniref:SRR1-like protein isoform X2 n=1 Tax=Amphiura filiformis TaxID=82378 RepID=UPI003B228047
MSTTRVFKREEILLSEFYEVFQGTWKNVLCEVASSPKKVDKDTVTNTTSTCHKEDSTHSRNKSQHQDDIHVDCCHSDCCHDREFELADQSASYRHGMVMQSIVCYGLGNFTSCVIARYQLAFLLLLVDITEVSLRRCYVYDPKFTCQEQDVLAKLGFQLITCNEEGKRCVNETTLFYMPHCGKPLYNNLLWANWGLQLRQVIIIGNSFSNMCERLPSRQLTEIVPYIVKMQPLTKEWKLQNNFRFQDIFNDLGIHAFPIQMLQKASTELWKEHKEPTYHHLDNVEIILS